MQEKETIGLVSKFILNAVLKRYVVKFWTAVNWLAIGTSKGSWKLPN